MSGHTPGPWTLGRSGPEDEWDCHWVIQASHPDDGMWHPPLMGNPSYYPYCPDIEADWCLIAAAPDLLEACRQALVQAESDETTHGRKFGLGNVLRAAIARATGAT